MPLTPGFDHDIFVSYGHLDNELISGMASGWVTTLVADLKIRLEQLIGRRNSCAWWWDERSLPRHGNITPSIIGSLEKTAVLLVILSPSYLQSQWCAQEREAFLQALAQRAGSDSQVFIVEKEKMEWEQRPAVFQDMIGYRFWEDKGGRYRVLGYPKTEGDNAYYDRIEELARALHQELLRLGEVAEPALADEQPISVYLAESSEDLDTLRGEVKVYLEQAGFQVLPKSWYTRSASDYQQALDEDLNACIVFIQLLGPLSGRKFQDAPYSYVELQYRRAVAAGKPILQWRDRSLDLDNITDIEHHGLLTGTTVLAMDIAQFKREVVTRSKAQWQQQQARQRAENPAASLEAFVFVNNSPQDRAEANRLAQVLQRHGCAYALTLYEGTEEDIREDRIANLRECDGLIIIYGDIPRTQLRRQLRECRTWLSRREQPLRALALYQAPPPEGKQALGMGLPHMQIIDCRHGLDENRLRGFLEALAVEAT